MHRMARAKAQYQQKGVQLITGMPVITASTTTRDQAITDLIQSVALEETALSHILNAEGEKIQKMVALPDVTPEVLLATNKSVESMVNAVSRLEMIFQSKLSNFSNCLCQSETSQGQQSRRVGFLWEAHPSLHHRLSAAYYSVEQF